MVDGYPNNKRPSSAAMDNVQIAVVGSFTSSIGNLNSHKQNSPENVVSSASQTTSATTKESSSVCSSRRVVHRSEKVDISLMQWMECLSSPNKKNKKKKKKKKKKKSGETVSSVTPPAVEIEEFFSVAEKYEQKRFAKKYNYDIVKDVALEGRYQWMKLIKP